jgi:CRISPR/Cas system endoribonuclease Cas6 (RAMP superfamily)
MSNFHKRSFFETLNEELDVVFELFHENNIPDEDDEDAEIEDIVATDAYLEAKELYKILLEVKERVEAQL